MKGTAASIRLEKPSPDEGVSSGAKILYYALGGGLGHLTRARAFLHTLGIENDSAILTSSPFSADKRLVGNIRIIRAEEKFERNLQAFREFLQNIFAELKIETVFIDSFPFGIIGEFSEFEFVENIEINYVARLLKWENYSAFKRDKTIRFGRTFLLEPLENAHQEFVDESSNEQIKIELQYPEAALSSDELKVFRHVLNDLKPFWLIVHAGDEGETSELIDFAAEMREIEKAAVNLVLISPNDLPLQKQNLYHFNFYPASVLFCQAERIFTACGFNAMQQTRDFRDRHFFIPFQRRYDDQFARARRFREIV